MIKRDVLFPLGDGRFCAVSLFADENLTPIPSPLVGTFYRAGSPDADPFVQVGTRVNKDTVVCIIEAMKVMNEIKAEASGVIKKILVENATAVQFGQPMFLIEKA